MAQNVSSPVCPISPPGVHVLMAGLTFLGWSSERQTGDYRLNILQFFLHIAIAFGCRWSLSASGQGCAEGVHLLMQKQACCIAMVRDRTGCRALAASAVPAGFFRWLYYIHQGGPIPHTFG